MDTFDGAVLDELENLASTAGAIVLDKVIQKVDIPTPTYFIGRGKVEEIRDIVCGENIDVVIFDNELSPGQIKNLETALGVKVLDRTELILDIFATHARTHQARLQVELAQLEYKLPRLKRLWTHLSQQKGGAGIGQRGPGEKQIEVDRRLARKRINELHEKIRAIESRKRREVKTRAENYTISLVGYTNAGKSTLMNALTGANVLVDDKLFSTLDTRTRLWSFGSGQRVLLSDTVGFIKNLPHHLIASFHATLEEVRESDLLLHVVDVSSPFADEQIISVNEVLKELGCEGKEILLVFNKLDKLRDMVELHILQKRYPQGVAISALRGDGIDLLEEKIENKLSSLLEELEIKVPICYGKVLSEIFQIGQIEEKSYSSEYAFLKIKLPKREVYKYTDFLVSDER
jgi:GTP-binding protein HflX